MLMKHLVFSLILMMTTATLATETAQKSSKKRSLDPKVIALIEEIDAKTDSLKTMQARFTLTKNLALMKAPTVTPGDFLFRKENGFKFAFDKEHDLIVFLTTERVVTISHEAKKANDIAIKQRQNRIAQKLISQKIKSLTKYFNVELNESVVDGKEQHHLVLKPAKRRLKKRFQQIEFWVTEEHLIYRTKTTLKDGDSYDLFLQDLKINDPIEASEFDMTIPTGYEIGDKAQKMLGLGVGGL